MNNPIKEALKEGLRVIVLALVSWLLTDGVLVLLLGGFNLPETIRVQIVLVLTILLRSVDKWLHERAEEKGFLKKGGLTLF
jgi:hypothetical protein